MILYKKYKERRNKWQISKKEYVRKVAQLKKNGFNAFYYPGKVADDMAIISVGGS